MQNLFLKIASLNKSYKSIESDNVKRSITLKTTGRTLTPIENITNRMVYNILRDNIKEAPPIENKLIEYYPGDVNASLIYSLPYKNHQKHDFTIFPIQDNTRFLPN